MLFGLDGMTSLDLAWVAGLGLVFVFNHGSSYRRFREADQQGCPNIGTLMFLPYARVVPMHLTVIIGMIAGIGGAVLLFGLLKTLADVLMHVIEHKVLAGTGEVGSLR